MPPLYPPEYPYRPEAPLLSMGPSFSEETARSVIAAIWHENPERPHETDVRTAAALTMLEAFHPRDQLETMLAAQNVAAHCAIMDSFGYAANPELPLPMVIKLRASAVSMNRMFCLNLHQLQHLQSRPLPPRPGQTPEPDGGDPPPAPKPRRARAKTAASKAANRKPQSVPEPPLSVAEQLARLDELSGLPQDMETRPDGTPGNLTAYAPKAPPPEPYVPPREAPIMMALALRPKPWRQVNGPKDQEPAEVVAEPVVLTPEPERPVRRGLVDLRERIFTGDALARFAATRLDPNVPLEPMVFESNVAEVELELISTGGDPEAEAHMAAMKAAHPEGKPIVTYRYGTEPASNASLPNGKDDVPDG
jgi:hypothetical protein